MSHQKAMSQLTSQTQNDISQNKPIKSPTKLSTQDLKNHKYFLNMKTLILHIVYYDDFSKFCGDRSTRRSPYISKATVASEKNLVIYAVTYIEILSWRYLSKIADLIWISKTFMVPLNVICLSTCITKLFVFDEILLDLSFSNYSRVSKI